MESYPFKGSHPSRGVAEPVLLKPPLREVWTTRYSTYPPVAFGGRLFLGGKHVLCLDEATGKERWSIGFPRGGGAAAIWMGQVLAVAVRGPMSLLDVETGATLREYKWPWDYQECLIVDDLWVAHDLQREMYAASLADGVVRWRYPLHAKPGTGSMVSGRFSASPTAVFFGRSDGRIHALSLDDGHQIWETSVEHLARGGSEGTHGAHVVGFTHVLGDLVILRLHGGWVVALSASSGSVVWKRAKKRAIADGQLYRGRYYLSFFGGAYEILDARSGEVLFETDLNATVCEKGQPCHEFFPILVSETHLFAGVDPGMLAVFERETGRCVWCHRVKGGSSYQRQTYFMSINGRLFFADMGNKLYCYEEAGRGGKAGRTAGETADAAGLTFEIAAAADGRVVAAFASNGVGLALSSGGGEGETARVLQCRVGGYTFSVAIRIVPRAGAIVTWGEGQLWVGSEGDRDRLAQAARKAFGGRRARIAARGGQQGVFQVAVLGQGVGESGTGEGTWTHTKWTGEDGSPEFYIRWSEAEKRGVIAEKDEAYRKDLLALFASLVVRG